MKNKRMIAPVKTVLALCPLENAIEKAFPSNWCDPILTGPAKVLGNYPFGCPDIEKVVQAIKVRVLQAAREYESTRSSQMEKRSR